MTEKLLHEIFNDAAYIILDMAWPKKCDFIAACYYGNFEKVKSTRYISFNQLEKGFEPTCKAGYNAIAIIILEIMKTRKSVYKFCDLGLGYACYGGHLILVQIMIKYGAKHFDWGLRSACEGGYPDLVDLMIENGANNFNSGLSFACKGNNPELVDLMIHKYGAREFNYGLTSACEGGHKDLAKFMITLGATEYIGGFFSSVKGNHPDLAKLMAEYNPGLYSEYQPWMNGTGPLPPPVSLYDDDSDEYDSDEYD